MYTERRGFFIGVCTGLLIAYFLGTLFITKEQRIETIQTSYSGLDDLSIANDLKKRVRVLIWVCTTPKNLNTKAIYVKKTWAKRADKVLFFSSETDTSFPTIGLNTSEGRDHLTAKTMQAFQYIYKHHLNDFDWFMKADDDTFILMENLRYFLSDKNSSEPIFYGKLFKITVKQGFYSGGAGYVLSREALRRLGNKGMDPNLCKQDSGYEDVEMSRCMEKLNVRTTNANDALGRSRFHFFTPEDHVHDHLPEWYTKLEVNKGKSGQDSIGNYPISFHYVNGTAMETLEFYFYHVRLYGVRREPLHLNP